MDWHIGNIRTTPWHNYSEHTHTWDLWVMGPLRFDRATQDITWKTHNGGKNHDSPRAVKYTIWEEYRIKENTEATTSCLLLHHTRRRLQGGGNDLFLSLSLTLCNTLSRRCACVRASFERDHRGLGPRSYWEEDDVNVWFGETMSTTLWEDRKFLHSRWR